MELNKEKNIQYFPSKYNCKWQKKMSNLFNMVKTHDDLKNKKRESNIRKKLIQSA